MSDQPTNIPTIGAARFVRPFAGVLIFLLMCAFVQAQTAPAADQTFRVGERLTYTVGFEKFSNVAYAELYTVSRGKIGDLEAVELRSRIKTLDFVSAAFYLVDESRTIFAAPDSGLPLYVNRTQYMGGLPRDTVQNFVSNPTTNFDLVTMIYKIRHSEGSGSLTIFEGERLANVTYQQTPGERIKTETGEFDTNLVSLQSDFFTELGIRDFRINISTDEARIPVLVRFRTAKGEFRAKLASNQKIEPQPEATPTPVPVATPKPTPQPTPTPRSYTENQPLNADLSFVLGETLEYKLTTNGQPVASFNLQASKRIQVDGADTLVLTANVTDAPANGLVAAGDAVMAMVNPETLGPRRLDIRLTGPLANLNQQVLFDERSNVIRFKNNGAVEGPVGTHSILSLLYAIRSFNLKPSRDTNNPINDTRVAVFWENRPYIFTLRPGSAEVITVGTEKVSAQRISVATGNQLLDSLSMKVWLSNDARRVPLKFSIGRYEADLVGDKIILPK